MELKQKNTVRHVDFMGEILEIESKEGVTALIFETNGPTLVENIQNRQNVQKLINYLQNWVDTGDFEGTKEAESND
jgi:hypothetical protein